MFRSLHTGFLAFFLLLCAQAGFALPGGSAVTPVPAKAPEIRVEPPNWWVDMANDNVQLLLHGEGIGAWIPEVAYPGVRILEIHKAESPNYLFIDLEVGRITVPGTFQIILREDKKVRAKIDYTLQARNFEATGLKGFDASDAIYLITPDRFANGNPDNDVVEGMREQGLDRNDRHARHGGDLRGMIDALDYIAGMGFTAIWPCPIWENDMDSFSYHGYACTDYYKVDPRYGTMDEYVEFSAQCRARGIKLIQDQVVNHCGSRHWWMEDLPFSDWLNFQSDYPDTVLFSNHRHGAIQDPYASERDRTLMTDGWFVETMPDLNQRNPFMARYLIQNSIWWIETLQLGGIRQDTYPYADKDFLRDWSCAIMDEYPNFSIVGEEWSTNPRVVSYWQQGKANADGYSSCLGSVMDFANQVNLVEALIEEEKWNKGFIKLYDGLGNDNTYASPENLLVFGDNHDMSRLFTWLEEDVDLHRMALTWIATVRGIPQVYYGTEILMENTAMPGDHGLIRSDFPGGWEGDAVNALTGTGLGEDQAFVQGFTRELLNWRKDAEIVHTGQTMHFSPFRGIYTMARYFPAGSEPGAKPKVLLVVFNKNEEDTAPPWTQYEELLMGRRNAVSAIGKNAVKLDDKFEVPGRSAMILMFE